MVPQRKSALRNTPGLGSNPLQPSGLGCRAGFHMVLDVAGSSSWPSVSHDKNRDRAREKMKGAGFRRSREIVERSSQSPRDIICM